MRCVQTIGYVLHLGLLVIALSFASALAQPQLAQVDSLAEVNEKSVDVSQDVVKVVVDSLSPEVIAQLVKAINPVVKPNNTRLTLMPTARPLHAGTGYIESMLLFFWSVGYGISDRHAILAGASLFPGVDVDDQVFYVGTKSSLYKSKSIQLAGGLLSLNQKFLDDRLSALYGVATLGNADGALSLFVSYGFEGTKMGEKPLMVLGGERRFGRRTYFVGELPIYDNQVVFPILGIKRYSEDGQSHWGYTFPYFVYYSFGFGGD